MSAQPLSSVQLRILAAAQLGRQRALESGVHAYRFELLHSVYGLPLAREGHPGKQAFDPKEIGRSRYICASVALSKAIRRLEKRGLIRIVKCDAHHWSGIALTSEPPTPCEACPSASDASRVPSP